MLQYNWFFYTNLQHSHKRILQAAGSTFKWGRCSLWIYTLTCLTWPECVCVCIHGCMSHVCNKAWRSIRSGMHRVSSSCHPLWIFLAVRYGGLERRSNSQKEKETGAPPTLFRQAWHWNRYPGAIFPAFEVVIFSITFKTSPPHFLVQSQTEFINRQVAKCHPSSRGSTGCRKLVLICWLWQSSPLKVCCLAFQLLLFFCVCFCFVSIQVQTRSGPCNLLWLLKMLVLGLFFGPPDVQQFKQHLQSSLSQPIHLTETG